MSENVLTFTDLKGPSEAGQYHRFLCMTGENKGTSYILIGLRVVAGRGKNIDIQINDTKASREHFELAKIKESYVLTDLKSQNGTIVNDLKVTQHRLSDHDTVIVGKTIFKYSLLTVLEKGNYLQKKESDEIQIEKLKNEKSVINNFVRGHQWMYDKSLFLKIIGGVFDEAKIESFGVGKVPDLDRLDLVEHKSHSLYIEATK